MWKSLLATLSAELKAPRSGTDRDACSGCVVSASQLDAGAIGRRLAANDDAL